MDSFHFPPPPLFGHMQQQTAPQTLRPGSLSQMVAVLNGTLQQQAAQAQLQAAQAQLQQHQHLLMMQAPPAGLPPLGPHQSGLPVFLPAQPQLHGAWGSSQPRQGTAAAFSPSLFVAGTNLGAAQDPLCGDHPGKQQQPWPLRVQGSSNSPAPASAVRPPVLGLQQATPPRAGRGREHSTASPSNAAALHQLHHAWRTEDEAPPSPAAPAAARLLQAGVTTPPEASLVLPRDVAWMYPFWLAHAGESAAEGMGRWTDAIAEELGAASGGRAWQEAPDSSSEAVPAEAAAAGGTGQQQPGPAAAHMPPPLPVAEASADEPWVPALAQQLLDRLLGAAQQHARDSGSVRDTTRQQRPELIGESGPGGAGAATAAAAHPHDTLSALPWAAPGLQVKEEEPHGQHQLWMPPLAALGMPAGTHEDGGLEALHHHRRQRQQQCGAGSEAAAATALASDSAGWGLALSAGSKRSADETAAGAPRAKRVKGASSVALQLPQPGSELQAPGFDCRRQPRAAAAAAAASWQHLLPQQPAVRHRVNTRAAKRASQSSILGPGDGQQLQVARQAANEDAAAVLHAEVRASAPAAPTDALQRHRQAAHSPAGDGPGPRPLQALQLNQADVQARLNAPAVASGDKAQRQKPAFVTPLEPNMLPLQHQPLAAAGHPPVMELLAQVQVAGLDQQLQQLGGALHHSSQETPPPQAAQPSADGQHLPPVRRRGSRSRRAAACTPDAAASGGGGAENIDAASQQVVDALSQGPCAGASRPRRAAAAAAAAAIAAGSQAPLDADVDEDDDAATAAAASSEEDDDDGGAHAGGGGRAAEERSRAQLQQLEGVRAGLQADKQTLTGRLQLLEQELEAHARLAAAAGAGPHADAAAALLWALQKARMAS